MRPLAVLFAGALAASALTGCLRETEFKCAADTDCSASGAVCESTGYCSFSDTACASGRRYGDFSGAYTHDCVGDAMGMADAGTDSDGMMADAPAGACPASYTTTMGAHVYRALGSAPWTSHRADCAADGVNAYLAIPDDATEAIAIAALGGSMSTWIGIDDRSDENTFETVRDEAPPYLTWDAGEPNNQGDQDCVAVIMGSGLLETDRCTTSFPAVCECEP